MHVVISKDLFIIKASAYNLFEEKEALKKPLLIHRLATTTDKLLSFSVYHTKIFFHLEFQVLTSIQTTDVHIFLKKN